MLKNRFVFWRCKSNALCNDACFRFYVLFLFIKDNNHCVLFMDTLTLILIIFVKTCESYRRLRDKNLMRNLTTNMKAASIWCVKRVRIKTLQWLVDKWFLVLKCQFYNHRVKLNQTIAFGQIFKLWLVDWNQFDVFIGWGWHHNLV